MLVNLKSLVIQMHVPRSSNARYSNIRRSPYVPLSQMQFSSSNASYSNIPRSSNQMEVTRIFPVPQMFLVPQMQVTQKQIPQMQVTQNQVPRYSNACSSNESYSNYPYIPQMHVPHSSNAS